MLEASLYISEHLPDGANGLWAIVHCATWVALGELEWIPFAVLRKSIDVNLLGKCNAIFHLKHPTESLIHRIFAANTFCLNWNDLMDFVWLWFKNVGAARLTQIFLPLIRRANGRIIFVSSGMHLLIKFWLRILCSMWMAMTVFSVIFRF